jgi:hypothetical protein
VTVSLRFAVGLIALIAFGISPACAQGASDRFIPWPPGIRGSADPAEISLEELRREEDSLRLGVPSEYDKEELAAYAPEFWKVPSFLAMLSGVEWSRTGGHGEEAFCDNILDDLRNWHGIRVVEPVARSNSYADVVFKPFHDVFLPEPSDGPTISRFSGLSGTGARAFKWFQIKAGDGSTIDLLTWEDLYALLDVNPMGQRQHGPIRKGLDNTKKIEHGDYIRIVDLNKKKTKVYFEPMFNVSGSFSYYFQKDIRKKYKKEDLYYAGEYLFFQYGGKYFFSLISIDKFPADTHIKGAEDKRELQIVSLPDSGKYPFYSENQENHRLCKFEAPVGDLKAFKAGD